MFVREHDVMVMSGTGLTATSLIVVHTFSNASLTAQQRTYEPQDRARACNRTEREADFRMSRCRHSCWPMWVILAGSPGGALWGVYPMVLPGKGKEFGFSGKRAIGGG